MTQENFHVISFSINFVQPGNSHVCYLIFIVKSPIIIRFHVKKKKEKLKHGVW